MSFEICALTNCADDHFYLTKWLDYYSGALGGRQNLFVLLDGPDPIAREIAAGASVIELPRRTGDMQFERTRWRVLQSMTETLSHKFDCVICGDVDELVTLSPGVAAASGHSLQSYLAETARRDNPDYIAPLAFDIIENIEQEAPLDPRHAVLGQRRFGKLNSKYAKPCVIFKPTANKLRPGGHIGPAEPWNLDPNLFLFHLKSVDTAISNTVSAARQARLFALENGGIDPEAHGIRGWREGTKYIDEARLWLVEKQAEAQDLAALDFAALIARYERRRTRIGRCPSIMTGPLTLGAEWQEVF